MLDESNVRPWTPAERYRALRQQGLAQGRIYGSEMLTGYGSGHSSSIYDEKTGEWITCRKWNQRRLLELRRGYGGRNA